MNYGFNAAGSRAPEAGGNSSSPIGSPSSQQHDRLPSTVSLQSMSSARAEAAVSAASVMGGPAQFTAASPSLLAGGLPGASSSLHHTAPTHEEEIQRGSSSRVYFPQSYLASAHRMTSTGTLYTVLVTGGCRTCLTPTTGVAEQMTSTCSSRMPSPHLTTSLGARDTDAPAQASSSTPFTPSFAASGPQLQPSSRLVLFCDGVRVAESLPFSSYVPFLPLPSRSDTSVEGPSTRSAPMSHSHPTPGGVWAAERDGHYGWAPAPFSSSSFTASATRRNSTNSFAEVVCAMTPYRRCVGPRAEAPRCGESGRSEKEEAVLQTVDDDECSLRVVVGLHERGSITASPAAHLLLFEYHPGGKRTAGLLQWGRQSRSTLKWLDEERGGDALDPREGDGSSLPSALLPLPVLCGGVLQLSNELLLRQQQHHHSWTTTTSSPLTSTTTTSGATEPTRYAASTNLHSILQLSFIDEDWICVLTAHEILVVDVSGGLSGSLGRLSRTPHPTYSSAAGGSAAFTGAATSPKPPRVLTEPVPVPILWRSTGAYQRIAVCPLPDMPHLGALSACGSKLCVFPHASMEEQRLAHFLHAQRQKEQVDSGGSGDVEADAARFMTTSGGGAGTNSVYRSIDLIFEHFAQQSAGEGAGSGGRRRGQPTLEWLLNGGMLYGNGVPITVDLGQGYRGKEVEWRITAHKLLLCVPCIRKPEAVQYAAARHRGSVFPLNENHHKSELERAAPSGVFSSMTDKTEDSALAVMRVYELHLLPVTVFASNLHRRIDISNVGNDAQHGSTSSSSHGMGTSRGYTTPGACICPSTTCHGMICGQEGKPLPKPGAAWDHEGLASAGLARLHVHVALLGVVPLPPLLVDTSSASREHARVGGVQWTSSHRTSPAPYHPSLSLRSSGLVVKEETRTEAEREEEVEEEWIGFVTPFLSNVEDPTGALSGVCPPVGLPTTGLQLLHLNSRTGELAWSQLKVDGCAVQHLYHKNEKDQVNGQTEDSFDAVIREASTVFASASSMRPLQDLIRQFGTIQGVTLVPYFEHKKVAIGGAPPSAADLLRLVEHRLQLEQQQQGTTTVPTSRKTPSVGAAPGPTSASLGLWGLHASPSLHAVLRFHGGVLAHVQLLVKEGPMRNGGVAGAEQTPKRAAAPEDGAMPVPAEEPATGTTAVDTGGRREICVVAVIHAVFSLGEDPLLGLRAVPRHQFPAVTPTTHSGVLPSCAFGAVMGLQRGRGSWNLLLFRHSVRNQFRNAHRGRAVRAKNTAEAAAAGLRPEDEDVLQSPERQFQQWEAQQADEEEIAVHLDALVPLPVGCPTASTFALPHRRSSEPLVELRGGMCTPHGLVVALYFNEEEGGPHQERDGCSAVSHVFFLPRRSWLHTQLAHVPPHSRWLPTTSGLDLLGGLPYGHCGVLRPVASLRELVAVPSPINLSEEEEGRGAVRRCRQPLCKKCIATTTPSQAGDETSERSASAVASDAVAAARALRSCMQEVLLYLDTVDRCDPLPATPLEAESPPEDHYLPNPNKGGAEGLWGTAGIPAVPQDPHHGGLPLSLESGGTTAPHRMIEEEATTTRLKYLLQRLGQREESQQQGGRMLAPEVQWHIVRERSSASLLSLCVTTPMTKEVAWIRLVAPSSPKNIHTENKSGTWRVLTVKTKVLINFTTIVAVLVEHWTPHTSSHGDKELWVYGCTAVEDDVPPLSFTRDAVLPCSSLFFELGEGGEVFLLRDHTPKPTAASASGLPAGIERWLRCVVWDKEAVGKGKSSSPSSCIALRYEYTFFDVIPFPTSVFCGGGPSHLPSAVRMSLSWQSKGVVQMEPCCTQTGIRLLRRATSTATTGPVSAVFGLQLTSFCCAPLSWGGLPRLTASGSRGGCRVPTSLLSDAGSGGIHLLPFPVLSTASRETSYAAQESDHRAAFAGFARRPTTVSNTVALVAYHPDVLLQLIGLGSWGVVYHTLQQLLGRLTGQISSKTDVASEALSRKVKERHQVEVLARQWCGLHVSRREDGAIGTAESSSFKPRTTASESTKRTETPLSASSLPIAAATLMKEEGEEMDTRDTISAAQAEMIRTTRRRRKAEIWMTLPEDALLQQDWRSVQHVSMHAVFANLEEEEEKQRHQRPHRPRAPRREGDVLQGLMEVLPGVRLTLLEQSANHHSRTEKTRRRGDEANVSWPTESAQEFLLDVVASLADARELSRSVDEAAVRFYFYYQLQERRVERRRQALFKQQHQTMEMSELDEGANDYNGNSVAELTTQSFGMGGGGGADNASIGSRQSAPLTTHHQHHPPLWSTSSTLDFTAGDLPIFPPHALLGFATTPFAPFPEVEVGAGDSSSEQRKSTATSPSWSSNTTVNSFPGGNSTSPSAAVQARYRRHQDRVSSTSSCVSWVWALLSDSDKVLLGHLFPTSTGIQAAALAGLGLASRQVHGAIGSRNGDTMGFGSVHSNSAASSTTTMGSLLFSAPGLGKRPQSVVPAGTSGSAAAAGVLRLSDLSRAGVAFWIKDVELLRSLVERLAYATYQHTQKDIPSSALFFILANKVSTLAALCKSQSNHRLEAFFQRNFRETSHRNSASANAYAAVSKNLWTYGMGFFLLAGDVKSAAQVAVQRLCDPHLALLVLRVAAYNDQQAQQQQQQRYLSNPAAASPPAPLDLRELLDWYSHQRVQEEDSCGVYTPWEAACVCWHHPPPPSTPAKKAPSQGSGNPSKTNTAPSSAALASGLMDLSHFGGSDSEDDDTAAGDPPASNNADAELNHHHINNHNNKVTVEEDEESSKFAALRLLLYAPPCVLHSSALGQVRYAVVCVPQIAHYERQLLQRDEHELLQRLASGTCGESRQSAPPLCSAGEGWARGSLLSVQREMVLLAQLARWSGVRGAPLLEQIYYGAVKGLMQREVGKLLSSSGEEAQRTENEGGGQRLCGGVLTASFVNSTNSDGASLGSAGLQTASYLSFSATSKTAGGGGLHTSSPQQHSAASPTASQLQANFATGTLAFCGSSDDEAEPLPIVTTPQQQDVPVPLVSSSAEAEKTPGGADWIHQRRELLSSCGPLMVWQSLQFELRHYEALGRVNLVEVQQRQHESASANSTLREETVSENLKCFQRAAPASGTSPDGKQRCTNAGSVEAAVAHRRGWEWWSKLLPLLFALLLPSSASTAPTAMHRGALASRQAVLLPTVAAFLETAQPYWLQYEWNDSAMERRRWEEPAEELGVRRTPRAPPHGTSVAEVDHPTTGTANVKSEEETSGPPHDGVLWDRIGCALCRFVFATLAATQQVEGLANAVLQVPTSRALLAARVQRRESSARAPGGEEGSTIRRTGVEDECPPDIPQMAAYLLGLRHYFLLYEEAAQRKSERNPCRPRTLRRAARGARRDGATAAERSPRSNLHPLENEEEAHSEERCSTSSLGSVSCASTSSEAGHENLLRGTDEAELEGEGGNTGSTPSLLRSSHVDGVGDVSSASHAWINRFELLEQEQEQQRAAVGTSHTNHEGEASSPEEERTAHYTGWCGVREAPMESLLVSCLLDWFAATVFLDIAGNDLQPLLLRLQRRYRQDAVARAREARRGGPMTTSIVLPNPSWSAEDEESEVDEIPSGYLLVALRSALVYTTLRLQGMSTSVQHSFRTITRLREYELEEVDDGAGDWMEGGGGDGLHHSELGWMNAESALGGRVGGSTSSALLLDVLSDADLVTLNDGFLLSDRLLQAFLTSDLMDLESMGTFAGLRLATWRRPEEVLDLAKGWQYCFPDDRSTTPMTNGLPDSTAFSAPPHIHDTDEEVRNTTTTRRARDLSFMSRSSFSLAEAFPSLRLPFILHSVLYRAYWPVPVTPAAISPATTFSSTAFMWWWSKFQCTMSANAPPSTRCRESLSARAIGLQLLYANLISDEERRAYFDRYYIPVVGSGRGAGETHQAFHPLASHTTTSTGAAATSTPPRFGDEFKPLMSSTTAVTPSTLTGWIRFRDPLHQLRGIAFRRRHSKATLRALLHYHLLYAPPPHSTGAGERGESAGDPAAAVPMPPGVCPVTTDRLLLAQTYHPVTSVALDHTGESSLAWSSASGTHVVHGVRELLGMEEEENAAVTAARERHRQRELLERFCELQDAETRTDDDDEEEEWSSEDDTARGPMWSDPTPLMRTKANAKSRAVNAAMEHDPEVLQRLPLPTAAREARNTKRELGQSSLNQFCRHLRLAQQQEEERDARVSAGPPPPASEAGLSPSSSLTSALVRLDSDGGRSFYCSHRPSLGTLSTYSLLAHPQLPFFLATAPDGHVDLYSFASTDCMGSVSCPNRSPCITPLAFSNQRLSTQSAVWSGMGAVGSQYRMALHRYLKEEEAASVKRELDEAISKLQRFPTKSSVDRWRAARRCADTERSGGAVSSPKQQQRGGMKGSRLLRFASCSGDGEGGQRRRRGQPKHSLSLFPPTLSPWFSYHSRGGSTARTVARHALLYDGEYFAVGLQDGSIAVWRFSALLQSVRVPRDHGVASLPRGTNNRTEAAAPPPSRPLAARHTLNLVAGSIFSSATGRPESRPVAHLTRLFARGGVRQCCFCGGSRLLAAVGAVEEPHWCPNPPPRLRPPPGVSGGVGSTAPGAAPRVEELLVLELQFPSASVGSPSYLVVARVALPFAADFAVYLSSLHAVLCVAATGEMGLYQLCEGTLTILAAEPLWLTRQRQQRVALQGSSSAGLDSWHVGVHPWETSHATAHLQRVRGDSGFPTAAMSASSWLGGGTTASNAEDSTTTTSSASWLSTSPSLRVTAVAYSDDEGLCAVGTDDGVGYLLPVSRIQEYVYRVRHSQPPVPPSAVVESTPSVLGAPLSTRKGVPAVGLPAALEELVPEGAAMVLPPALGLDEVSDTAATTGSGAGKSLDIATWDPVELDRLAIGAVKHFQVTVDTTGMTRHASSSSRPTGSGAAPHTSRSTAGVTGGALGLATYAAAAAAAAPSAPIVFSAAHPTATSLFTCINRNNLQQVLTTSSSALGSPVATPSSTAAGVVVTARVPLQSVYLWATPVLLTPQLVASPLRPLVRGGSGSPAGGGVTCLVFGPQVLLAGLHDGKVMAVSLAPQGWRRMMLEEIHHNHTSLRQGDK